MQHAHPLDQPALSLQCGQAGSDRVLPTGHARVVGEGDEQRAGVEVTVARERVESQPGDFYGGWITTRVVGPFKGSAGTYAW